MGLRSPLNTVRICLGLRVWTRPGMSFSVFGIPYCWIFDVLLIHVENYVRSIHQRV